MRKILLMLLLTLGGCVSSGTTPLTGILATTTVSKVDDRVATISAKLYQNCKLIEVVGLGAALLSNSSVVAKVNAGIDEFCNADNQVASVSTAIIEVGKIYGSVQVAK